MNIKGRWLTWEELYPYTEQLIDLEVELTQKYHYPEIEIPRSYAKERVKGLEKHMNSGNTFFWAIVEDGCLLGYYWAYISVFIDKKRWNLRSLMFRDSVKGYGYGKIAIEAGLLKAKEMGCYEAATEYVSWNNTIATLLSKFGYNPARIEVVKKL